MSIDLSLDRIRSLMSYLPTYTRPTCHIAGTNGEGSVAALVSSILLASAPPISVGRFNSPHLVSVHDSITIDNVPISEVDYANTRKTVEDTDAQHQIGASIFELLTATALLLFEQKQVEMVVLEVGMGGRLDATSVIPDECVLVSALTAVDLDHQAFLGDTTAKIAKEKAAIARPHRPFVLGPQKHDEVKEVVDKEVGSAGAKLWLAQPAIVSKNQPPDNQSEGAFDIPLARSVSLSMSAFSEPISTFLPLQGDHQLDNLGIAATIIDALLLCTDEHQSDMNLGARITPTTIATGVQQVRWPGRLSHHTITVPLGAAGHGVDTSHVQLNLLADGAHNRASAETLARYLSQTVSSMKHSGAMRRVHITYVLALSHSPPKTPMDTLSPLLPFPAGLTSDGIALSTSVALLRFSPPDGMPWIKSVPPSGLRATVEKLAPGVEAYTAPDTDEPGELQLTNVLVWAAQRQDMQDINYNLVVVAGSLYLIADLYRSFVHIA